MSRLVHRGFVLSAVLASLGATYRSEHFVVEGPNEEVARRVAEEAEKCRTRLARQWLGRELPDWRGPYSIRVTPARASSAATIFGFEEGRILSIEMRLEGAVEHMLRNELPHEITHVVLAYRFRKPVRRWADEGAAILAEEDRTQDQHEKEMARILRRPDRFIPLRHLFGIRDFPRDVIVLYAEGHSLARFLVEQRGRKTFLDFVSNGMDGTWQDACRERYGYRDVDAMEDAWLRWLERRKLCRAEDVAVLRMQRHQGQPEELKIAVPFRPAGG